MGRMDPMVPDIRLASATWRAARTRESGREGARRARVFARTGLRASVSLVAACLTALVLAAPVAAFQNVPTAERAAGLLDALWAGFVGCWEPVETAEEDPGLLCVRPAGGGVEMFTIADGEVRTSDLLVADGEPRPLEAEGCEGWEEVTFSDDGRRAFSRSSYSCEGIEQTGTGVLALVSPTQWVDARALEVDGERTSWVQRYRLVGADRAAAEGVADATFGMETAARAARFVGHRGVGFGQVEEAAARVDAEAVEAWLATRSEGFAPTGEDLVRLQEAGVPESVIDVVVAVSFPETFRVNAAGDAEVAAGQARGAPGAGRYGTARRSFYFGPRAAFGYRMLGYGYGYLPYDAYRYGRAYGYPGSWGYRPGAVIIERRAPEPGGRMIRGRGYTRGSSDDGPAAVPRTAPSGGERPSAAPPRRSGGEARTPDREDPPPRRTARPRPPGGG